jgi:probable HAF family extracellular repeat protein
MTRSSFSLALLAVGLCSSALAQSAPQYSLMDLGPIVVAGSGLPWQTPQPTPQPGVASAASLQGASCYGTNTNEVYADFGYEFVGSTCLTTANTHAAMWTIIPRQVPQLTDLGVLPGAFGRTGTGGPSAIAYGFNNEGAVVGVSDSQYPAYQGYQTPARHAFLWRNGVMTDLGAIAGQGYDSSAAAVNDSGEVVGTTSTISSTDGSVLSRAFMYVNGTTYNLSFYLTGGPTVHLSNALWIDCQGNIAANGTPLSSTTVHSYLLVRQGPARTTCPD